MNRRRIEMIQGHNQRGEELPVAYGWSTKRPMAIVEMDDGFVVKLQIHKGEDDERIL